MQIARCQISHIKSRHLWQPPPLQEIRALATIAVMVIPQNNAPPRLDVYLEEWLEHLHVQDVDLANSLGVARETIWKWKHRQTLKTDIIARIAFILKIKPIELLSPPWRPSVDAKLVPASDEMVRKIGEIAETLLKTTS